MDAPTFALDSQAQQDIINAFWRLQNPGDPAECAKRPVRAIDPQDGTHCLAQDGSPKNKVQSPELSPANR